MCPRCPTIGTGETNRWIRIRSSKDRSIGSTKAASSLRSNYALKEVWIALKHAASRHTVPLKSVTASTISAGSIPSLPSAYSWSSSTSSAFQLALRPLSSCWWRSLAAGSMKMRMCGSAVPLSVSVALIASSVRRILIRVKRRRETNRRKRTMIKNLCLRSSAGIVSRNNRRNEGVALSAAALSSAVDRVTLSVVRLNWLTCVLI